MKFCHLLVFFLSLTTFNNLFAMSTKSVSDDSSWIDLQADADKYFGNDSTYILISSVGHLDQSPEKEAAHHLDFFFNKAKFLATVALLNISKKGTETKGK